MGFFKDVGVGVATDVVSDFTQKLLNPNPGRRQGQATNAYFDEVAPDSSQFERIGSPASTTGAQIGDQQNQDKIARRSQQLQAANIQKDIKVAEINAASQQQVAQTHASASRYGSDVGATVGLNKQNIDQLANQMSFAISNGQIKLGSVKGFQDDLAMRLATFAAGRGNFNVGIGSSPIAEIVGGAAGALFLGKRSGSKNRRIGQKDIKEERTTYSRDHNYGKDGKEVQTGRETYSRRETNKDFGDTEDSFQSPLFRGQRLNPGVETLYNIFLEAINSQPFGQSGQAPTPNESHHAADSGEGAFIPSVASPVWSAGRQKRLDSFLGHSGHTVGNLHAQTDALLQGVKEGALTAEQQKALLSDIINGIVQNASNTGKLQQYFEGKTK